jgi:hypothetical protein
MRPLTGALAIILALGLAACETATPYQPAAPNAAVAGGFTDQAIDSNHYRVSFQGNSVTPRQTVENYLLYRSAELTVKQGYDWFEMVERKTDPHQETFGAAPYGWYWHPYWVVYGGRRGWRGGFGWGGDPFWDDPFWGDYDVQTIDRYQAEAEIAMGHGPKPDPKAMDAHEVLTNLGPTIVRPS